MTAHRHLPAAARVLRGARALRRDGRVHLAGLALDAARAVARPRARLRAWSHVDERVAGFFALGLAKATGRPVAIACTSGTAAAELPPAVIEAAEARVPLIVLTADRPPELRDVGAGQTIDQIKLYGDAAKWFVEVGTHEATPQRVRWMRALACRADWTALDGRPGPVHLNFAAARAARARRTAAGRGPGAGPRRRAAVGRASGRAARRPSCRRVPIAPAPRAVVVAGRDERDPALGEAIAAFAAAARYPLLADPLSGARRGPAAVAHYDALLRDERLRGRAARPSSCCGSATCRPRSRCARGSRTRRRRAGGARCRGRLARPGRRRGAGDRRQPARDARRAGRPSTATPASGWLERWRAADGAPPARSRRRSATS